MRGAVFEEFSGFLGCGVVGCGFAPPANESRAIASSSLKWTQTLSQSDSSDFFR